MRMRTHQLPTYISLTEASNLTGLSMRALREHITAGVVKAIMIHGELAVSKQSALQVARADVPKEDLPEYKQFRRLKGKSISITGAEQKYGISTQTISRWVQNGYIGQLGREGRKVLVDEADVAYCASVYKQIGGQGKRIFNPDGTPYTPKVLQIA